MLKRSIPKPTKEQQKRQDKARALGCILCRRLGIPQGGPTEIHHMTKLFARYGQDATVALCSFHHRSVRVPNWRETNGRPAKPGPSLAGGSKPFHDYFGSDEFLLAEQNALLELDA